MSVIPQPFRYDVPSGPGGVQLADGGRVSVPPGLDRLAHAFVEDVYADSGIRLEITGAAQGRDTAPALITVEFVADLEMAGPPAIGAPPSGVAELADERYRLSATDRVTIHAVGAAGAAAGLASLRQLISGSTPASDGTRLLSPCVIDDGPRYAWRGLKLDVARFWYPVDEVKRVISQLSRYKINVLVLHLVDNEGWRIEIEGYPEVAEASGERFTQADLKGIVEYARDRGIVVIAEIDLPGHCAALLDAHPEFGVRQHVEGHDIAYVDPSRTELWDFLRATYSQVLEVTGSAHLHLGGDEAFRMPDELFAEFVHRASALARSLGAEPIVYQEGCRAGLAQGSLVQLWVDFAGPGGLIDDLEQRAARGEELPFGMKPAAFPFYREGFADLARADAQGLGALLSPTAHAYFDTPFADTSTDGGQENDRGNLGMPVYTSKTLEEFGDWDPEKAFAGLNSQLIKGVEAALWSDAVRDVSDMQTLLLPRLPGFAERAWSHAPRHWREFRQALAEHSPIWRARGLRYFSSSSVDWK